uniref:BLOC-1-related complex subunit 5 n=1 Tax=Caenorhabditis tropicalis TaxID=1561998 RepID=A0A1I7T7R8_9PELO
MLSLGEIRVPAQVWSEGCHSGLDREAHPLEIGVQAILAQVSICGLCPCDALVYCADADSEEPVKPSGPHHDRHKKTAGSTKSTSKHSSRSSKSSVIGASKYGKWTSLGPAKTRFTKRASKAKKLIEHVANILAKPDSPDFLRVVQDCYRDLFTMINQLSKSAGEVMNLLQENPVLSSSSEVCNKNFRELSNHIKLLHYDSLIIRLEELLSEYEQEITKLNAIPRKVAATQITIPALTPMLPGKRSDANSPVEPPVEPPVNQQPAVTDGEPHLLRNQISRSPNMRVAPTVELSPQLYPDLVNQLLTRINKDMEQMLKSLLTPLSVQLKRTEQLSRSYQQIVETQQQQAVTQQYIQNNVEALQAQMKKMQKQMMRMQKDISLRSVPLLSSKVNSVQTRLPDPDQHLSDQLEGDCNNPSGAVSLEVTTRPVSPDPLITSPSPSPTRISPGTPMFTRVGEIGAIARTIKPFDGSVNKYALFITRFNSLVHDNPQVDTVMKHNMLISLLEGDAANLISTDDLGEESYRILRQNLEETYNCKEGRQNQLLDEFSKLPFHQVDHDQMDKDLMRHICLANSLQRTGVSVDHASIINSFTVKLPSSILLELIRKVNERSLSFSEITHIVRKLIRQERILDMTNHSKKDNQESI